MGLPPTERTSENLLLAGARQARLPRNPLLATLVLLGGVVVALLGSVVGALASATVLLAPVPLGVRSALSIAGAFAGIWFGLFLWVRLVERRPFRSAGFVARQPLLRYLRGVAIGIAMFTAVVGLMVLAGAASVDGVRLDGGTIATLAAAAIGYSVQGSAEEALLRGWLLPVAAVRFGLVAALIVQAVLFTLLHGLNPGITLIAIVNLALVSLFLGVWALREESIWAVMGWHAAWNWTQSTVFGIAVSGLPPSESLLQVKVVGPDWLTGGIFGAESTILASLVLTAGLLTALLLRRPAASTESPLDR
ncbi:MAG: hypothetical protein KatS3mg060_1835 [Dehalococcoidia bacterium]|nr:MAG: hypothetical protein KatS3mg060_1835 [Dehalococcoidia bacterium]